MRPWKSDLSVWFYRDASRKLRSTLCVGKEKQLWAVIKAVLIYRIASFYGAIIITRYVIVQLLYTS